MTKILVQPVSLGTNAPGPIVLGNAFYPLGCLVAYAKVHGEGALNEHFEFGRVTPLKEDEGMAFLGTLEVDRPTIFMMSSYVWNHAVNERFALAARERFRRCMIAVGGPHIPRRRIEAQEFFAKGPFDLAARGEGERTLAALLETVIAQGAGGERLLGLDFSHVPGLSYRDAERRLIQTPDQERAQDLAPFPSPYITGEFDHWIEGQPYAPFETNRGCPYGCTFCDWGAATLSKVYTMTMERVLGELEYAATRKIGTVGFCDANFGILPRDVEITRFCVELKQKYGFPHTVGYTNAKVAKPRLTEILKLLWDAGMTTVAQISMQTTNQGVLDNIKRTNILTTEYEKMIAFMQSERMPTQSDMMIGLPGQTFRTVQDDIQFFFDRKVLAFTFSTSLMPNAPMADPEYRAKYKIVADDSGHVLSTYSFTAEEFQRMFDLCLAYRFFVRIGVARYLMYVMQVDYGAKMGDFLAAWLDAARGDGNYPLSQRLGREVLFREAIGPGKDFTAPRWSHAEVAFLFDDPVQFFRELLSIYESELGVRPDSSVSETISVAQAAVFPTKSIIPPASVQVAHDLAAYLEQLRGTTDVGNPSFRARPLKDFGPGSIDVTEPGPRWSYDFADLAFTPPAFELKSNLRLS